MSCFSSLRVRLSFMGSAVCELEMPRGADSTLCVSLGGSCRACVSPEVGIMEGGLFVVFELREREGYLLSLKSRSEIARPCWKKLRWRFGERGETVESRRVV